ncbi:MAG: AAA family ATPase, partial [Malacoplasma sp.]|nr:AAA family ATPase [Malacoplasma sp.]
FTFSQDDSISFRLKTKIKNQDKETEYFLKIIENKIQKNNEEINKISENIKTYFEDIDECLKEKETNEKYLEKKSNEINEFSNAKQRKELDKKNLNFDLNSQNESVKKILNQISELELDIENNNNEYESFEIEEKYKEIKKLIEEKNIYEKQIENIIQKIKNINDDIQSLNENLSKLKNEESVIENKINELNIKVNYLERSINQNKKEKDKLKEANNNLNTLKECFTDKKFFVFKVSFSFNDEVENMDFVQIPFYDLNKAEQNLSTVSEDINGFRQKIKRYFHAISHAIDGNYRNPYLLHSINATPEIREIKELPLEIINKYNLNPKQLESVKKAISSRDTFYLQGPPGTGKTQVISAITDVLINQNKNVLMTSSTHEAIHNFFDRLNDLSSKNPNIILLKDSATDKEAKYSESNLYKNFIQKIKNHLLDKNNHDDDLVEEIEKIKEKLDSDE